MANDQEIGRLVLRLVAEVSDLKKGLQDIRKVVQDTSAQTKASAKSFDDSIAGIKKSYLALAAGIYAAYQGIRKAFDFAEMGAKAQAVAESFEAITREVGVNGDRLISSIKESSKVYVDETDLMLMSSKLLAEGIAATDIPKLFEAARVAARLMGTSVNEAMELITRAVLTFQTRGLFKQAFPMESEKVFERYAETLKLDADMLSAFGKQQAMVNEILRQAAEKARILGGRGGIITNNYENLQLLNSAWEETKELLATIIVNAIMKTSDALGRMIDLFVSAYVKIERFLIKVKDTALAVTEFIGLTQKKPLTLPEIGLAAGHEAAMAEDRAFAVSHGQVTKARNDKELADQDKLQKALTKLRLDAEKSRIDAEGQIRMAGLEAEYARAIASAKEISEDIFLIDQEYQRKKVAMELQSTLASLKAQEAAEVAAAVSDKRTREIPTIRKKIMDQELVAYAKFNAQIQAMDAKTIELRNDAMRKAVQIERGITPELEPFAPTETQMAEMEKRSVDYWVERDRWQAEYLTQLAEVTGDYEGIIAAQTRSLEAERAMFQASETYAKLSIDQQKQYNDLMDVRIAKTRQVRDLESLRDVAEWRREIGELTGNWIMVKDAEIEALIIQRDYLLTTQALTPTMREYIKELYALKIAEIEARKNMDALGLSVIGFRKYTIQVKTELADTFENVLPNVMKSFWDTFEEYLKRGEWSWRSFADSLRSIWANLMRKMAESLVNDLLNTAISGLSKILGLTQTGTTTIQGGGGAPGWAGYVGLIGGLIGGLGKSIGGLFTSSASPTFGGTSPGWGGYAAGGWNLNYPYSQYMYQKGGPVEGPSGIDAVPIRASAGEFIHSAPAVRHYGESVMAAINARLVPRDILLPYAYEPSSRPAGAFQAGGMVTPGSSISSNVTVSLDNKRDAAMLHAMIERSVISILKEYSR